MPQGIKEDPGGKAPVVNGRAEARARATEQSEVANAKDDSPSENHRAGRGGDQQAEGLVVNVKDDSPGGNQQAEGLVVSGREEARAGATGQGEVVPWEELLVRAGCGQRIVAHARAVTSLALSYCESSVVDRELVRAGAMLHDIGRGSTHGPAHAQQGAALARTLGLDPSLVSIIERHLGAGLTADECSLLGLAPRDCMPATAAEKIVANADNLVHGITPGSIERTLAQAPHLKRRIRRRFLRLYLEMEAFRQA
jgi:uncharacterized protein